MSKAQKWIAIVAGALALIAALGLTMLDRIVRSIVVQVITSTSGRELVIGGDFKVDIFPWPPRVRAEQVRFANAPWGTEPLMLDLPRLEFTIEPSSIPSGRIVASEVVLTNPTVVLEKSRDGTLRNWILSPEQTGKERGPRILSLIVDAGAFTLRDPAVNTALHFIVATNPAAATAGAKTTFSVEGELRGLAVTASGEGGDVIALRDRSTPFPIDARFHFAGLNGTLKGTVTGLPRLTALDVALTLSGKNIERLAPLVELPFKGQPFKGAGRLTRQDDRWKLADFNATLGDSQLAGTLEFDRTARTFSGKVLSKLLDVGPLRRVLDSPSPPASSASATPGSQENGWARPLRELNGALQFEVSRLRNASIPIEAMAGTLQIRRGMATIDALAMNVAGGKINSTIRLDGTQTPPAAHVLARIQNVTLAGLFPSSSLARGAGGLGGQIKFTARGDSPGAMLAMANGSAELMITGGEIDAGLIESLHLDPRDILRFAFGSREKVRIHCAVADFKIQNGVLHSQSFVIDTPNTTAAVTGSINTVNRSLDLTVKPVPTGPRLFSAPAPFHITGNFASPKIKVDSSLYVRGGAALLLGLINPLGALLPLIDLSGDQSGQCAALLTRTQALASGSSK